MPKQKTTNLSLIHHPEYDRWAPTWAQARDVYEGAGGFVDPDRPYLVPHPREWLDHSVKDTTSGAMVPNDNPSRPSPKLKMRRRLARYENIAAAILDTLLGALFAHAPTRTFADGKSTNDQIAAWWKDTDGLQTPIDTAMADAWLMAAVFGHSILLTDKPDKEAETAAEQGAPRLCLYTPLDLQDWLTDEYGKLTAVKLAEAEPRSDFSTPLTANQLRTRVVDEKEWALYDAKGKKIDGAPHGFGRLPVEILYGKRRPMIRFIGKTVMGDPQLFIDCYNLTSEVRELLRNQTFALLNVPIGVDGDPQREQEKVGQQSGTSSILFSTNPAAYLSPGGENVQAYHEHLDRLARMIYRLAAIPWEGDSRDAESADSRRVKRQELTSVLMKYRHELQRVDDGVTDLVYRAIYGADHGPKKRETDKQVTAYPVDFAPPSYEDVLAVVQQAVSLDLGETATKELKKRVARGLLPNLTPDQQEAVDGEIDGQTILSAEEKQQQLLEQSAARMARPMPKAPKGAPKGEPPPAKEAA